MPTPPKTLTAEQIIAAQPKTKTVKIDSLGGKITVRQLLVSDQMFIAEKKPATVYETMVWMLICCCVDPVFTPDQFEQLKSLPADALDQIDDAVGEAAGGESVSAKDAEKSPVAES